MFGRVAVGRRGCIAFSLIEQNAIIKPVNTETEFKLGSWTPLENLCQEYFYLDINN